MKPVRILTAGAAVVALAITSVGTTVAQDGTGDAAWFEGTVRFAPSCDSPELADVDGVRQERGYRCTPQTWQTDDARFGGAGIAIWNADVHEVDGQEYSVTSTFIEIRGDDGGWVCRSPDGLELGSGLFTDPAQGTDRLGCEGIGANSGLSAIIVTDFRQVPRTVEGLIFPGELAPVPSRSSTGG